MLSRHAGIGLAYSNEWQRSLVQKLLKSFHRDKIAYCSGQDGILLWNAVRGFAQFQSKAALAPLCAASALSCNMGYGSYFVQQPCTAAEIEICAHIIYLGMCSEVSCSRTAT